MIEVIKRGFKAIFNILKSTFLSILKLFKLMYVGICRERDKKRIQKLEDKVNTHELKALYYKRKSTYRMQKFCEKYYHDKNWMSEEDETNA